MKKAYLYWRFLSKVWARGLGQRWQPKRPLTDRITPGRRPRLRAPLQTPQACPQLRPGLATKCSCFLRPKVRLYSPWVPGAARGGEGMLQTVERPKGTAARRKMRKQWPAQEPPAPNFQTWGTPPANMHLAPSHFRELSRNPGGLKALWSAQGTDWGTTPLTTER